MANENFYISIPNVYNKDLVIFENNKFKKAFLKCGEAINQDVDTRLAQEAANAGGMFTIYSFSCDIKKFKKNSHIDTEIFGHGKIADCW